MQMDTKRDIAKSLNIYLKLWYIFLGHSLWLSLIYPFVTQPGIWDMFLIAAVLLLISGTLEIFLPGNALSWDTESKVSNCLFPSDIQLFTSNLQFSKCFLEFLCASSYKRCISTATQCLQLTGKQLKQLTHTVWEDRYVLLKVKKLTGKSSG